MKEKTLGKELIAAVKEALASKEHGKIVRPKINIRDIRKKLGMTQQQFAKQYHIKLQTIRNWEQAKRLPDTTGFAYLTCIAQRPKLIQGLLRTHK